MAEEIQVSSAAEMVETQLRLRGIRDERVLAAMLAIPRGEFVAPEYRRFAWEDRPLPIGAGQTISQPYMVAVMTEALRLTGTQKVLEVGTGSGYQTAVLALLAAQVLTIERERELAAGARAALQRLHSAGILDITRIVSVIGDGTEGFPDAAPYDAILVAAAAPSVPPSLVAQLAEGGRLVIPVGDRHSQELRMLQKRFGQLIHHTVNECRFVPLVGKEGWKESA